MGESKEEDVQASSVRSAASDPRRASGGGLVHPETVASQGGVSGEVRRGSVDADIPEGARERCEADRAAGRAAQKPTAERRNSVDADTPRDRDSNKKRAKLDLAEAERKEEEEKKPALHDAHATQVAKGQRKSRISRIAAMVITKTVGSGYKVAPRGEAELKRTRLIAEVNAVRRRLQTNNKYVMAPTDKSVRQWDIVTFLALLFTAVVTPAEVAFLDGNMDALWFVNRTIDLVFISDICLQFFIGYKDASRGNVFINDRVLIAKRYMRSWFWIDCVSTFPIDVVAYAADAPVLEQFGAMRLLKLLKLGRIGRVKRMMERWEVYAVFAVSYAEMSMYKSTVLLIIYAHWTACLWGVIAHPMLMGDNAWTWKDAYTISMTDAHGGRHFDKGNARHSYLASLYMAVYTMTGIGYGDITPTNQAESAMITTVMIMSAVFWAFMIGNFCSLVSTMNVHESMFRTRMDNLNSMMTDRKFPTELRRRCRMFLLNSKQHQRMATYSDIENYFSLSLRGEVAATSNEEWIKKVWYLRNSSKDFIIELSQSLGTMMFAPMEAINVAYTLFILQAGIAARKGRILSKGSVWGADFIVRDTDLIDRTCAASLSYTMVLCIGREHILEILENDSFDLEYVEIVKAANFYCFKTLMVRFGRQLLQRRKLKENTTRPRDIMGVGDALTPDLHHRAPPPTDLSGRFSMEMSAFARAQRDAEPASTALRDAINAGDASALDAAVFDVRNRKTGTFGDVVDAGDASDASVSDAASPARGGGDGSPARPAPERKPSKRTMLNRMSVTKLPAGFVPPARHAAAPPAAVERTVSIPEFDALLYDDDDDDGDGDGAGRNSMVKNHATGQHAGRRHIRPPTQEEKINSLCETVSELAACVQDLTEYMPRSFARLERALHQLDRDRRSSSLSAVHRPRASHVTPASQYDHNETQHAALDHVRQRGDPRASHSGIH
ncbi:voltage-gated potassium channel [Aureococcus anophagefferens]|uniref:Voltage-gated potassium channel n=1 Tax=Aureococcus anophagefferens TaxID=44056 RepID=A0ABR1FT05_AURAN